MIFVTVGTSIGGGSFDRLIKKMDYIAPKLKDEVIMQIASSKYIPTSTRYYRYLSYEECINCFKKSRLIIGHCGSGTAINAINFGVPLIAVPRISKFAEHSDDHQIELAEMLEKKYPIVKIVYDVDDLECAIVEMLNCPAGLTKNKSLQTRINLIENIKRLLNSINN
jgi:UDP-N-acetylglucosamine transferase subunit ALG13